MDDERHDALPTPEIGLFSFRGQPATVLSLHNGDAAIVAHHGGQLLSWQAEGREQLYLSPRAIFDGRSAIRGGLPICFPQFNQRIVAGRSLPKHGFARAFPWVPRNNPALATAHAAEVSFTLTEDTLPNELREIWPFAFCATLSYRLEPRRLRCTFSLQNTSADTGEGTGAASLPFALAFHTYLAVADLDALTIEGLGGLFFRDALVDPDLQGPAIRQADGVLRIRGAIDRIYESSPARLTLREPGKVLVWAKSPNLTETVVWNPGPSSALADLPADGHRHMVCVEAARLLESIHLEPGQSWSGWQELALDPAG